jgi:hypothetical protein
MPVTVIADAPNVNVRVFVLDDENDPQEHVCPLVLRVPLANVTDPVTVSASAS